MSTFSKQILAGSTNGRPVRVALTATPGTIIHTAIAGITDFDEVWLYATNTSTGTIKLTIELGGVTAPDDLIEVGIPGEQGLVLVVPGLPLNNGVVIRAFAESSNVINIVGWVNEIRS